MSIKRKISAFGWAGALALGICGAQAASNDTLGASGNATRSSSIRLPNGVSQPMYKNALPLSPPEKPVAIPVRIPEGRARLEQLKKVRTVGRWQARLARRKARTVPSLKR